VASPRSRRESGNHKDRFALIGIRITGNVMSEVDADGYVAAGHFGKTSHIRYELGVFRVFA